MITIYYIWDVHYAAPKPTDKRNLWLAAKGWYRYGGGEGLGVIKMLMLSAHVRHTGSDL